jgi:uncharacterized protein
MRKTDKSRKKPISADKLAAAAAAAPAFDPNLVLGVMRRFNPWWEGKAYSAPAFHRTAFFACRKLLDDDKIRRAVLLSGPRRVGKTTILKQLAEAALQAEKEPLSVCYLSLDHPVLSKLPLLDLLELYHENIRPEGRPVLLLLDEVQYSEEWDLHLKQLIDHRPEYRIAATGSASIQHRRKLSESGVGRWVTVPAPTLSFSEFLQIRNEETSGLASGPGFEELRAMQPGQFVLTAGRFRALRPRFGRYLLLGGFPESALKDDMEYCHNFLREDVIDRVLKRDMTSLFHFRNTADLEKLFVYLCLNDGGLFSITDCAKALGSTRPTVANYLEALEEANLLYLLPPFRRTGKKALKAAPKVYLADATFANAVLLRGEEILADGKEMGKIVESAVLRHLLAYYHHFTPEITYWRGGRRDREVDFIVRTPRLTLPIEVKYRSDASLGKTEGLLEFCEEDGVEQALVVTQQDKDFDRAKIGKISLLRLPAHIFCYLLSRPED